MQSQPAWVVERGFALVRKAEKALAGTIALKPFASYDCINRTYNRLNEDDYKPMHHICRFFLENTGPTHLMGGKKMVLFLVNMAYLFEKFVECWLRENLPEHLKIKAQVTMLIDTLGTMKLKMDLVIYDRETNIPLYVLDTKYKNDNLLEPHDYYQVKSYSHHLGCKDGILIYPQPIKKFEAISDGVRVQSACFDIREDIEAGGQAFLEELG